MEENKADITQSPEYKKKAATLESLKTELAKLITERDTLENTVKKNLEALYATKIGKNEFTLFKTECEITRLKRKLELFQAKINHGEKFNTVEIDGQLDTEYKKWEKEMARMLEDINNSKKRLSSLMTEEDSIELQSAYRSIVKKLHPDVNPDQKDISKLLWNRAMAAYARSDLEELRAIKLLIGAARDNGTIDSGPKIDDYIQSIKIKIFDLLEYIKKIKSEFPFTIEHGLNDNNWVANKNSEIFKKLETLNNKKEELQQLVDMLLLKNLDGPDLKTIN